PSGGRTTGAPPMPRPRAGDPARNLAPLGNWTVKKGVPKPCLIGLGTCWEDGSVWAGYRATVTGQGLGLLDGLLGSLVGGLLINRCDSLLGNLIDYNGCVRTNLASYIQTAPDGFLDAAAGGGVTTPGNNVSCSGVLCTVLSPVLAALKPVLNTVGSLLSTTLASLLGLELGRTDVNVQSIQCNGAQLVF
ncbi:hypothetical protein I5U73_18495, partial [Stenotrophomonas maltophilia]|nr:hypothetical protein [Stenotrophomonas maltophilia]